MNDLSGGGGGFGVIGCGCDRQVLHSTMERSSGNAILPLAAGVGGESVKDKQVASARSKWVVPASFTAVVACLKMIG
jgi:hypothetical protein